MSFEKAKAYLTEKGYEDRIHIFDVSTATVELAAAAVGTEPRRIAKSLTFKLDGKPIMIVCAGDAKINNSKFKAFFHQKAVMLAHDEVGAMIGHEVGGVCPFGVSADVSVFLDESLRRVVSFSLPAEAATAPLSFPLRNWSGIRILRIG